MNELREVHHFPRMPDEDDAARLRARVRLCEDLLRRLPSAEFHVEHYFAHGLYGRVLYIPAGCLLTGKLHKYSQLNVLLMGDISVLTEDGIKRVQPPFVIVSPAGTKRIAYAHADTMWLTILGTHEQNVEKIEQEFIAKTEQDYDEFRKSVASEGGTSCLSQ